MRRPWGRNPGAPPRVGFTVLKRGAIAAVLVVALTATAVASAVLFEVDDVKTTFLKASGGEQIDIPEITQADAGGPRTFLILGSDARYGETRKEARSDTILLVRVDPRRKRVAVLSLPRDLKVAIPGFGVSKINDAYSDGGPRLTVKTIKQFFRTRIGKNLEINNVINVDFGGFRKAINYIGGVYVDVDRRYFNDNSAPGADGPFATINIQEGYQKLKGQDALDYVRFRHYDSDIYRAARQQDFLRQVTSQGGAIKLLDFSKRKQLARIFGRYFQVDKSFTSSKNLLSLIKSGLFLAGKHAPVNEVRFPALDSSDPSVDTSLSVSDAGLQRVYREFITGKGSTNPRQTTKPSAADKRFARSRKKASKSAKGTPKGLENASAEGRRMAVLADPRLSFPFYYPALRTQTSRSDAEQPRIYGIRDEQGKLHKAYKLVLYNGLAGEYYGVEGMDWRYPPLLLNPDSTRDYDGRKLELFYDGKRLRIVAWRTNRAVYWVSNTLTQGVSNSRLIAIARSLSRLRQ